MCQTDFLSPDDCEWPPAKGRELSGPGDVDQLLADAASMCLKKGGPGVYREAVSHFERLLVTKALELHRGNQVTTAKFLGISRNTLREKIDKNGEP